jgi:aryl-alcohol dehydrogenase-like predicted oxidoreductase
MMEFRRLGRSGVKVSPLGLGTARMAGLGWREDLAPSDVLYPRDPSQAERDAVQQIQAAVDLGVTFFDTADNYGQGLSERILGEALRRLGGQCIDLYLLHRRDYPLERAPALMEVLEDLVRAGKIRYYGWSTDDVERARLFARGEHCIAIEHRLNVFNDHAAMLDLCREQDLASLNRVPARSRLNLY